MKRIRSKPLAEYLASVGLLPDGSDDAVAAAKQKYRRTYKRDWKRRRTGRKEIRIIVTLREYGDIKVRAADYRMTVTGYARIAILSAATSKTIIPREGELRKILQLISIAAIGATSDRISRWELADCLNQAERLLLHYLKTI